MPAFDYDLLWRERALRSVANFTREDARDFLAVASEIPIEPRVETFPLERASEAMEHAADRVEAIRKDAPPLEAVPDKELTRLQALALKRLQPLQQRVERGLRLRIGFGEYGQYTDPRYLARLLRARGERPKKRRHGCGAAEQRDELAPFHSTTSSARPSSGSGTVRPSALAVLRLMISSTFVDCCTGRSPGFSPLRIFPT